MGALAVRFLAELGMLAALCYWGFHEHGLLAGVAAPLVAAAVWGLLISPKARIPAPPAVVFAVELALFAVAVAALAAAGQGVLAGVLGAVYAVDRAVLVAQNGSLEIEQ
jgi:Protein of unknown function (DUF2568)